MASKKRPRSIQPSYPPQLRRRIEEMARDEVETDMLAMLHELYEHYEELGAHLAWLALRDESRPVRDLAMSLLTLGVSAEDNGVPVEVMEELIDQAVPILEGVMREPDLPDERRFMANHLLQKCEVEIPHEEFRGLFKDFPAAMERVSEQLEEMISDAPASVQNMLSGMNLLEKDADPNDALTGLAMLLKFGEQRPEGWGMQMCTLLAIAHETGADSETLQHVIELISERDYPRLAWLLGDLGRWPAMGDVGRAAATAASAMVGRGVAPAAPLTGEFYQASVSMVDGSGSRSVAVLYRTEEGGLDGGVFILNERVGMKDAWGIFEDAAAIQETLREQEHELRFTACTLERVRELIADAWALHERLNKPLPGRFMIYRPMLGAEPIVPRPRVPNLGAYMPELLVPSPKLAEQSIELTSVPPYHTFDFTSDVAFKYVREHLMANRRKPKKQQIDAFLDAVESVERPLLTAHMAANLEVEAMGGRAQQRQNQIALRLWKVLESNVCPLKQIPYARELAARSVATIRESLDLGYNSQDEANQVMLDMDDAGGMIDEF